MKTPLLRLGLAGLALAVASIAHADTRVSVGIRIGRPAPVIVHRAPPRPVVEKVIVSPGPGYVWVAGHQTWRGNAWVWEPGIWVLPPQPGATYVTGYWDERGGTWVEGYWNVPAAPVVVAAPAPDVIIAAPPALRVEVRPARPSRQHVWITGNWVWHNRQYEWIGGHWEIPPRGHRHWIAATYERRGNAYIYVQGRWK